MERFQYQNTVLNVFLVVGYLPTTKAPATELDAIQELTQSELIRTILNLEALVIVMDQTLHAKPLKSFGNKENNTSLRLGAFHVVMNVLSIFEKRFQDAMLRNVCMESGILTEGSVTKVLEGKNCKKGVRTHKCVFEALMIIMQKAWDSYKRVTHAGKLPIICEHETFIYDFHHDIEQEAFQALLDDSVEQQLIGF